MKKNEVLQIRLTLEKKEKLKEISERENINISTILCNYIDKIILENENIIFKNNDDTITQLINENLKLKKEIQAAKERARRGGRYKKLNEKQVEKIKKDERKYTIISDEYNISVATISKIKNDKYKF